MGKTKNKPVLVIAGPGAGKTYDMVDRIMDAIPHLQPHRILAAITYTNAATSNIKERLAKRICIPPNVFIGTNHSFCYRFIFKPFGHLAGMLPKELVFMDIDYGTKPKEMDAGSWKIAINLRKKRNLENGRYGYEQILTMSGKILEENELVRTVVCNRLQYLFIDEFQDANSSQSKIIEYISKEDKTVIYAVGDPEQYIFRFTDTIKSYENIAINKFKKIAKVETNTKNHRSCDEIVRFIKQFHCDVDQRSERGSDVCGGVYFIPETDLDSIIKSYRSITSILKKNGKPVEKFYLSYVNKTFEDVAEKWELIPVSNDATKGLGLIDEAIKIISAIVGKNSKQICEKYKLDRIALRKKGLLLVIAIRKGKIKTAEDICTFIENNLELEANKEYSINNVEDKLRKLNGKEFVDDNISEYHMHSSIHKAKGLEADAVLVVAEDKGQLTRWLITEKETRYSEKTDMCRLGYVAFSRAKTMLCIACLKNIDKKIDSELTRLGVTKS
ncbi:MAG: ATP-dependent helicase [Planctomycetaceae bacterium]|nr:ATP-dependent helicase [Planctomycetaceae bacterium]